jgi:hypothetical protein
MNGAVTRREEITYRVNNRNGHRRPMDLAGNKDNNRIGSRGRLMMIIYFQMRKLIVRIRVVNNLSLPLLSLPFVVQPNIPGIWFFRLEEC